MTVDLEPGDLLELLRTMMLIRRFEERTLELQAEGLVHGAVHPSIGQEAAAVGVCSLLRPDDRLVSTHRGHGHCIAKGADLDRMMAELFGRRDGYCRGKGGSMHVAAFEVGMLGANGIVAGGLPIAAGAALAEMLVGSDNVAVGFFGDGATGEGAFHEAMNVSRLWSLPVVWVCENNRYAADTPLEDTMPTPDAALYATGYDMPSLIVDGNDVLAVRTAAAEAITRARTGGGPTFIEAKTFRRTQHVVRGTPVPDPRPAEIHAEWLRRDPIDRFSAHLAAAGELPDEVLAGLQSDVDQALAAAIAFAAASPFPELDDAFDDMFGA
ncbi:thiamine pyrophosphate-dependent dehydrogenase E1 component subunit alpha [Actinomycetota bacterium]